MLFRVIKYLFLFLAAQLLFACVHKQGDTSNVEDYNIQNPNTANGKTDLSKLPVFKFTEEEYNFGTLIQGEKVSHSFVFTNTGGSNLVIKEVKASCGCTTPKWTKASSINESTRWAHCVYKTAHANKV